MDTSPGNGRKILLLQAFLLAIAVSVLFWIAGSKLSSPAPAQNDQLLVADFLDSTGENTLVQGLRQVLLLALNQSPHLRLFPESRATRIMSGMGLDPSQGMTQEVALAICRRESVPYLLIPHLSRFGAFYLLSARLVQIDREGLRERSVDTMRTLDKTDLILAFDQVAVAVRRAMGETEQSLAAAGRALDKSAALNPEALALLAQALALGARGNYQGELSVLQQSVLLNPHLALAQLKLGELCLRLGWREAAAGPISAAVRESAALPFKERYRALGTAFLLNQEYDRAREQYRVLVDRYPSDPDVRIQLAEASSLTYDFAAARDSFEKTIHLDDSRVDAHLGLCLVALYDGSPDAARKAWERASALEPANTNVIAAGGLVDLINNDLGAAQRAFRRLSESPSVLTRSLGSLLEAQAQIYGGRFGAALATLAEGIAADQERSDMDSLVNKRLARAGVFLLLGDEARAVEECRQVPGSSHRAEVVARIGTIYAQAHRIADAQGFLRRVEGLPSSLWVRYQAAVLRGEIELASGRPQAAIPLLTQAREIVPGCRPLEPLARALAQAHLYEQAEKEYRIVFQQAAVMLFPPTGGWFMGAWPNSLYEAARCLEGLGKKGDALQYYRNYLWVLDGADTGLPKVLQAREALKKSSSKSGIR